MPYPIETPEQVRARKVAEIESINRMLTRGTTKLEDAGGHKVERNLQMLFRRRDELLAEIGGIDGTVATEPTGRIRQVRMICGKGL